MRSPLRPCLVVLFLVLLTASGEAQRKPKWDRVQGLRKVKFKLDKRRSDEFNGNRLDTRKWDPHSLRNKNTNCPKWNGPIDWVEPIYSTYHETTTGTKENQRNYRLRRGKLLIRVTRKSRRYFTKREYYCDKKTFHCNHNKRIPCYGTTYNGYPILKDNNDPKSYMYVVHDKCKMEPYCIPSPKHITGSSRKYQRYLGINISGKKTFKYGFFETRVKIAKSPAVTAVWMHDDNMVPGYNRWVFDKELNYYRFESPTPIRSRRWQEIDILEAMNAERENLKRKYIPNIHVFAGYKGEYTARRTSKTKLGPIILDRSVFTQPNPEFNPPDPERNNEYHMNWGNTLDGQLSSDWASSWRTVGMYWSPREIRFMLDGKETLRLKNTLVHQPMFWTLGTGLNKQWAGRAPSRKELGKWSQIDYVRRWTVRTRGGRDPPSDLPLQKVMPRNFVSYGNSYLSVDGVFPVKDDGETLPDPASRFFSNFLSQLSNNAGTASSNDILSGSNKSNNSSTNTAAMDSPASVGINPFDVDEFPDMPWDFWQNTEDEAADEAELAPAAGEDNEALEEPIDATGFKEVMSPQERQAQTSREDRMRRADTDPFCDKEGARTAFEDSNPETNLAGWATREGSGVDAGVVPNGQCA